MNTAGPSFAAAPHANRKCLQRLDASDVLCVLGIFDACLRERMLVIYPTVACDEFGPQPPSKYTQFARRLNTSTSADFAVWHVWNKFNNNLS